MMAVIGMYEKNNLKHMMSHGYNKLNTLNIYDGICGHTQIKYSLHI